jgi:ribosomal protein L31
MTYTVDGTRVDKTVTRQPLRGENIGGSYIGGWVGDQTACTPASDNGPFEEDLTITITHPANNSVTMTLQSGSDICTFAGTYSQSGHMGQIQNASISCPSSSGTITGTLNVYEIERSISGFSARFNGRYGSASEGCTIANGRLAGVRR